MHTCRLDIVTLALLALSLGGNVGATEPRLVVVEAINRGNLPASTQPVRLPPIDNALQRTAGDLEPFALTPVAHFNLIDLQAPSAFSLGVGMPGDSKPSIGGWISFGYPGRGISQ